MKMQKVFLGILMIFIFGTLIGCGNKNIDEISKETNQISNEKKTDERKMLTIAATTKTSEGSTKTETTATEPATTVKETVAETTTPTTVAPTSGNVSPARVYTYKDEQGQTFKYNTFEEMMMSKKGYTTNPTLTKEDMAIKIEEDLANPYLQKQKESLFNLVNELRKKNGLNELVEDSTLDKATQHRAIENGIACWNASVLEDGKSHHLRPNGKNAGTIYEEYGIKGTFHECYGRGYVNSYAFFQAAVNSTSHLKSLLSTDVTKIGVGVTFIASYGYYYFVILN